jgi:uncharacterized phage protein gp47/JayE
MPWQTPTLYQVRSLVRDQIHGSLPGSDATIPNSVLRVLSDSQGALCFLTLEYIDWLALQLMPDTAEAEWLDRHGQIWLKNSDGTVGRKLATVATGSVLVQRTPNIVIGSTILPIYSQLTGGGVTYETLQQAILVDDSPVPVSVQARDPGSIGNQAQGSLLSITNPPFGVSSQATVQLMTGGTDDETDDELRYRVLKRIQQPPMGGDASDWELWALAVPGVTRAWVYPQEMGIGTVTVRFMMDDLRATGGGFPLPDDVIAVENYLNTVRPVTVKDMFVEAPVPTPIPVRITYLDADNQLVHNAIVDSLLQEFLGRQRPGQTWYRAWTDEGIMKAVGVNAYDLVGSDVAMVGAGYMPILGDVTYG